MTREEAKTVFLNRGYVEVEGGIIYDADKWREACVVISEWLEQEPSSDCISRQAVLEAIDAKAWEFCDYLISKNRNDEQKPVSHFADNLRECVREELPSVNPQERTGHWEWVQYDYNPKIGNWHCTECRCIVVECVDKNEKGGIPLYKYCPQCGAKMEVEQNG